MLKGALIAMIILINSVLYAIPPDELPFGAMYLYPGDYADSAEISRLANDMCFNYFVEYKDVLNSTNIGRLYDYGIQSIRGGIQSWSQAEAPMKYSWSNYAVIDVDYPYPNEEVRMESFGDSAYFDTSANMWVSPRNSQDTLSGFSTYLDKYDSTYRKNRVGIFDNYLFNFPAQGRINYRVYISMKIDEIEDTSDIIAYIDLEYGRWNTCEMYTVHLDTIKAGDFIAGDSLHLIESGEFTVPDSIMVVDKGSTGQCDKDSTYYFPSTGRSFVYLTLSIATTGSREVSIDKIVISDRYGLDLMAGIRDTDILDQFQQYVTSGDTAKIYGWMLMDEPFYANFLPFRRIDSLMHTVYSPWVTFTDNWYYSPAGTISRSYLDIVGVDFLNPDIYPYGTDDVYSGIKFQHYLGTTYGPLWRFNNHVSWVREAVDEKSKDFWLTAQAFEGMDFWRYPTGPELSCNVFMALTWGCRGIQFWYYDVSSPSWGSGIRDASQDTTRLYNQIKNHIGPYIQAVDEYYMPLSWDTAYTYHSGAPVHDPPGDAYVSSISAWVHPDSVSINPDAGWFHVGEFADSSNAKYIILVNRACSQGETSQNPAPSVTATVKFDVSDLGLGNYVYIIDLADSLRLAGADTGWVGIPDTTYSANLGGTIPFTTVLGPGEGRLFKIVETTQQ